MHLQGERSYGKNTLHFINNMKGDFRFLIPMEIGEKKNQKSTITNLESPIRHYVD
jgi:hypothetical protein